MGWLDRLRRAPPPAPADPQAEMDRALAAARAGDYATALDVWERLARAGQARALNEIVDWFSEVKGGLERLPSLAARWLQHTAAAGDQVAGGQAGSGSERSGGRAGGRARGGEYREVAEHAG